MRSIGLSLLLLALAAPAAAQVPVPFEEVIQRELSRDDPRDSGGRHYDAYRFEARAGRTYLIVLSTDGYDARVHAGPAAGDDCSPCETALEEGENGGPLRVPAPASGTYVVRVTSVGAGVTGQYWLLVGENLADDEAPLDSIGSFQLAPGEEQAGALDETDGQEANPGGAFAYSDLWFYEGRAEETITVTARSGDFDAMLEVTSYDGWGNETKLGTDDNGGGGRDARVRATLPDFGPVHVRVTAREEGQGGAYTVRLESDMPARVESDSARRVDGYLERSEPVRGTLDDGDPVVDGRPADVVEFWGQRGHEVTLTVRSDDFAPTLLVAVGPTGAALQATAAENGDHETRLTLTLPYTTSYLVRVTPARAGQSGRYEITLDGP
jgi:hypothetical protein